MRPDWIAIGEIVAPHGVSGEVRVQTLGSFPERFRAGLEVRLASAPQRPRRLAAVRRNGPRLLLKLEGSDDRAAAEALRGERLLVPREERHPLPEDTYYVDDLRGLPVETSDGRGVGVVREVLPNPANDLLVVDTRCGGSALVPAVRALVHVDLPAGRVRLQPIPGLLPEEADSCGSTS